MTDEAQRGRDPGAGQAQRSEWETEVHEPHEKCYTRPTVSTEARRRIPVVTAVIERDGQYLITQRRPNAVFPLLWEFPGGRREDGESNEEALRREIRERLDVDVEVVKVMLFKSFEYEHYTLDLHVYECRLENDAFKCKGVQDFRWVTSAEFDQYEFTPADEASMAKLLGE
jgi:8-oxo-dGTP diphosphatase